jgi:hypothetical protein
MNKLIKAYRNPKTALIWLWWKSSRFIISDALYLKVYFRLMMGEKLDLQHPKTFNQKTQWLKLHNTDARYTQMVDKFGVREIIKKEIGEEYLIPLLGVWNEFDDIDFEKLPGQFVLKATHDNESIVICKDKSALDIDSARKKLNSTLRRNYFYRGREYPYKNVKPRIICEQYMVDESGTDLKDYKFYCFNGEPKLFIRISNRFADMKFAYYDMELNRLPFNQGKYVDSNETITKIESFDTMIEIAKKFSKGIPFVRVDLYNINGKIYFGEFTFHDDGGVVPFHPQEWDKKLGDLIKLPFE